MAEWDGGGHYNEWVHTKRVARSIISGLPEETTTETSTQYEPKSHKLPSGRIVLVYPLKGGETFRKIVHRTAIDGTHLSIKSQKDIDDLKTLLNEIEEFINPPKKQKVNQNRFAEIDLID